MSETTTTTNFDRDSFAEGVAGTHNRYIASLHRHHKVIRNYFLEARITLNKTGRETTAQYAQAKSDYLWAITILQKLGLPVRPDLAIIYREAHLKGVNNAK